MELNIQLRATDGDPLTDPTRYRHLVGSLVYLAVTRPDISYPVHILSQFVSSPSSVHYSHLLRVLRYLCGTISRRLFFPCSRSLQLQAYSDARGPVILLIAARCLPIVFFLEDLSLPRRRRNRRQFPAPVQRLSCERWIC